MQSYRGEDRRLAALAAGRAPDRELAVGAAILAAAWLGAWFLPSGPAAERAVPLLAAAAGALALVAGTVSCARWLVAGEAPSLLAGAAALCWGTVQVGAAELIPRLRPASSVMVLVLLALGVVVRQVDTRVSPAAVLGGGAALLAAFALAPALPAGSLPFAVAAAVLSGLYAQRGRRHGHWLLTAGALLLLALALAEVVPGDGEAGPWAVRLVGLALALRGALRQLLVGYRDQSASLLVTRVSLETAEHRIRDSRLRAEEQAHEARSALAAIEGATSTLEHYRDRLPAETQAQLRTAVHGEIRRLQRLVDPVAEPPGAFDLGALVQPLAAAERVRGSAVEVRVPTGLRAVGRPEATADILRGLLDNARRHGRGPITLQAEEQDGRVRLRVEDRGRGVPPAERAAVFERGIRGSASHGDASRGVPGSGLGLALAAELAKDQDGSLTVEDGPGGGASFLLELPAASAVRADDVEHSGEVVEHDGPADAPGRDAPHAPVGLGRQTNDDPRGDVDRG